MGGANMLRTLFLFEKYKTNIYDIGGKTKTPWSWGRMHDFCAFSRKGARSNPAANLHPAIALIETRGKNLETIQNAGPWTTNDARERRFRNGLDPKLLKTRKRDSIQRMWIEERERKTRGKKVSVGMKHSRKIELQQETRPVEAYLLHWMLPKQPFIKRDGENK